jgi:hypothetical protein
MCRSHAEDGHTLLGTILNALILLLDDDADINIRKREQRNFTQAAVAGSAPSG